MKNMITREQIDLGIYTYYWNNKYRKFICRYNKNKDKF